MFTQIHKHNFRTFAFVLHKYINMQSTWRRRTDTSRTAFCLHSYLDNCIRNMYFRVCFFTYLVKHGLGCQMPWVEDTTQVSEVFFHPPVSLQTSVGMHYIKVSQQLLTQNLSMSGLKRSLAKIIYFAYMCIIHMYEDAKPTKQKFTCIINTYIFICLYSS